MKEIVNTYLSSGYFPFPLNKRAIIQPNLKKTNFDPFPKNYHPLSNLTFFSKISEKAASQVIRYFKSHNLFLVAQSAYRENHSTEIAPLKVTNDIFRNMNRKHITLLVLLDLSSAFDTVDHTILLTAFLQILGSVALLSFGSNHISQFDPIRFHPGFKLTILPN